MNVDRGRHVVVMGMLAPRFYKRESRSYLATNPLGSLGIMLDRNTCSSEGAGLPPPVQST